MIAGCAHLIPVDVDPDRDREAWLADRLNGHGGSDVAKILHVHPSEGPIDVWSEHTSGVAVERSDNARTKRGRFLEPVLLKWFEEGGDAWPRPNMGGPIRVVKPPTVYHRDRPWQRGSADGLGYYGEAIAHVAPGVDLLRTTSRPAFLVEVKTHGFHGSRGYALDFEDGDDGEVILAIPADKRVQCAWYMELYEVDVTYLQVMADTHLCRTFALPRDLELGAMLLEEVDQFRRKYIQTNTPPPPDGSGTYSGYLKRRFRTHGPEVVTAGPEVDVAAARLIALKVEQKLAKDEREKLEQVVKAAIADNAGVRTASGVVTWKSQATGRYRDSDLRDELIRRLGMTAAESRALLAEYSTPDHRVLRTPQPKR